MPRMPSTTKCLFAVSIAILLLTTTPTPISAQDFPNFAFTLDSQILTDPNDPAYLNCSTITYGIDWFGKDNLNQRFVEGEPNPYFDIKKKTIIHVPGWERGRCAARQKTTFNFKRNQMEGNVDIPVNENAADYWVDDGWNIGVFQWNSFNELGIFDTETSIYEGNRAWINDKGDFIPNGSPYSVTELFYQTYISVFNNSEFNNTEIRLTGNSLGTQLVIQLTKTLIERHGSDSPLIPKRIALLDPWFTREKTYSTNLDAIRMIAEHGILIEYYLSSPICYILFSKCKATEIKQIAALVRTMPDWVDSLTWDPTLSWSIKHVASFNDYYRSKAYPPPKVACLKSSRVCDPEEGLSAASSNDVVRREMGKTLYLQQINGTRTPDLGDDVYARIGDLRVDDSMYLPKFRWSLRKFFWRHFGRKCQAQTADNPAGLKREDGRLVLDDVNCEQWIEGDKLLLKGLSLGTSLLMKNQNLN